MLEDVTIKNIKQTNISCLDQLATVSLSNVVWEQVDDFKFLKGRLDISNDVKMTGAHTFAYQSSQQSTIRSNGILYLDSGMTFSYDPGIASGNLIGMESNSKLYLNEVTLHSTTTGLQLTSGSLIIEGECKLESEATVESEGIVFGDGVLASNDLDIHILPESSLNLVSGFLVYKNVE